MRRIWLLPTWVLYRLCRNRLPEKHPWRGKNITFESWCDFATPLCVTLGQGMTISGGGVILAVAIICLR